MNRFILTKEDNIIIMFMCQCSYNGKNNGRLTRLLDYYKNGDFRKRCRYDNHMTSLFEFSLNTNPK